MHRPTPTPENGTLSTEYLLDAQDRIVWVDAGWDAFALANDAPELTDNAVIGRPLLGFITGLELRQVTKLLLTEARHLGRPLTLPYCCDAPCTLRHMLMTLTPLRAGELRISNYTMSEIVRLPMPILDRRAVRQPELRVICAWCRKIQMPDLSWLELDSAVKQLELLVREPLPTISHGICATCRAQFLGPAKPNRAT